MDLCEGTAVIDVAWHKYFKHLVDEVFLLKNNQTRELSMQKSTRVCVYTTTAELDDVFLLKQVLSQDPSCVSFGQVVS